VKLGTPEWERLQKQLRGMSDAELRSLDPRAEIERQLRKKRGGGAKRDHADDAAVILERAGLKGFEREVRFHPERRWRFDLAHRAAMVAVEIEGMNCYAAHPGKHRSVEGYSADLEKYNSAALGGWMVLRFTTRQMNDGTMVDLVRRALERRRNAW